MNSTDGIGSRCIQVPINETIFFVSLENKDKGTWYKMYWSDQFIRKTCPCKVYPLEPHFYIAKLGYVGVYLFFLFLLQNIDCGYSLEPPRRGGSNVYPQSMF